LEQKEPTPHSRIYDNLFSVFNSFTITKTEAASFMGISLPTFNRKIESKDLNINLPKKKRGKKTYICLDAFAAALADYSSHEHKL